MSTTPAEAAKERLKQSNDDRKRDRLRREAQRAHEYRVQIWAQMDRKIKSLNAQAEVLGAEAYEPFEPDFDSPSMVEHYATMTLTK